MPGGFQCWMTVGVNGCLCSVVNKIVLTTHSGSVAILQVCICKYWQDSTRAQAGMLYVFSDILFCTEGNASLSSFQNIGRDVPPRQLKINLKVGTLCNFIC